MIENGTPLEYGKLAPAFRLESVTGESFSREQFRGKAGLVLIFFREVEAITSLLAGIAADSAEYVELNARILAIGGGVRPALKKLAAELPFPVLDDHEAHVWRVFSGLNEYAYGVFVLDTYGGVEVQHLALDAAALPSAADILEWVRGAQYKCNI